MGPIFIIAGNHQQYKTFIPKKAKELWTPDYNISLSHFHYVTGSETLQGYSNPTGYFIGSWIERKDLDVIFMTLYATIRHDDKLDNVKRIYDKWRKYHGT
jgi:hypothetical protein